MITVSCAMSLFVLLSKVNIIVTIIIVVRSIIVVRFNIRVIKIILENTIVQRMEFGTLGFDR